MNREDLEKRLKARIQRWVKEVATPTTATKQKT